MFRIGRGIHAKIMKDLFYLTRQILNFRLTNAVDFEDILIQQFFSFGSVYFVAAPSTTEEEWTQNKFGIATEQQTADLFLEETDASHYAERVGSKLNDGTIMIRKVSASTAKEAIADYAKKQFIQCIFLHGKAPVKAGISVKHFLEGQPNTTGSTIMETITKEASEKEIETQNNLELVDQVRNALSTPAAAERKKLDPGQQYENFHSLLEKLVYANQIQESELDRIIGVPEGFTKNFCRTLTSNAIPKKILERYLKYFGLSEYIYIFAKQCSELSAEIKDNPNLNKYPIKGATVHTKERFKLLSIRRGKDQQGAYVYQAVFESKHRKITQIVSNQLNLIVGKEYELDGLQDVDEGVTSRVSTKDSAGVEASPIPSEEEEEAVLKQLEEKAQKKEPAQSIQPNKRNTGKNRYIIETPEEKLEKEKNIIIKYIIETEGCNAKKAQQMLDPFVNHIDVIECFAKYLSEQKFGSFAVRGYTPKKLMDKLHLSPYEAFCKLAELEEKPDETLQWLKYRETDPQYNRQNASNESSSN